MNEVLAKHIFKTGAKLRNPNLFDVVAKLHKTDFSTQEEFKEIQRNKLKNILSFYSENSSFYKELELDRDPFDTLAKQPILVKEDLIVNHDNMQCYQAVHKCFDAETSGSTGEPFRFKKDVHWDTYHRASIIRSYDWYGIEPWARNGYFWGYSFNRFAKIKTRFMDKLQNRFRAFNYQENEIRRFLRQLKKAEYLHGYSSMIFETAKLALEMGMDKGDFSHLKLIKGTSEKIYDYYHEAVERAFGKKIISEYGSAEAGIIAFECPHGNMHINEDNVLVEVIDGEAVLTNLNAFSFPVLRYKIGDKIKLGAKCSCGRHSRTIEEVIGRSGKLIEGKINKYPSLTLYYIFKNIALKKNVDIMYKGIQKEKGSLEIHIPEPLVSQVHKYIIEECKSYFQNDLQICIKDNSEIHHRRGKKVDFETYLIQKQSNQ